MNFKNYFYTILEMPQEISTKLRIETSLRDVILHGTLVDAFEGMEVWQMQEADMVKLFFIEDKDILIELSYTPFGIGIKQNLVIQNPYSERGLARKIYTDYLMKKFKFIMSDTTMTRDGFEFWKKLWKTNKNRFNFFIYDSAKKEKYNIENEKQMNDAFGKDKSMHNFQFVMVNK